MNLKFLFDLIRQLGPRLPEAWPHVMHIVQDLKVIHNIMTGAESFEGLQATESVGGGADFLRACEEAGVNKEEAKEALTVFSAVGREVE